MKASNDSNEVSSKESLLRFILSLGVAFAQPFFDDVPWAQPPEPRELTPQYHGGHVCSGFDEQWVGSQFISFQAIFIELKLKSFTFTIIQFT